LINTHPDTGIPYGVVALNDLDGDTVDALLYGPHVHDLSWTYQLNEYLAEYAKEGGLDVSELDRETVEHLTQTFNDDYEPCEPTLQGTYEGVTYTTCWLGGAQHLVILDSPHAGIGSPGSPCVPGMWFTGYGIPDDWWANETQTQPELQTQTPIKEHP
jgi:hypothetical protein